MKKLLFTLGLLIGLSFTTHVFAVKSSSGFRVMTAPATEMQTQMTVNDFLAFDVKNYRTAEGKKMGLVKRMVINTAQNKLEKKIKKGELAGTTLMSEVEASPGKNTYGLLSLIFGVAGWFIPVLGLAMIIAGFVLGIIGIRRDYNPTMAIIGTVVSALGLLIILLALVFIASGFWNWG